MGKRVYKYEIDRRGPTLLPSDGVILHADAQGLGMFVWVVTDPDDLREWTRRDLRIIPTGGEVPDGAEFVNTLLINGGEFVFHIFEVPRVVPSTGETTE